MASPPLRLAVSVDGGEDRRGAFPRDPLVSAAGTLAGGIFLCPDTRDWSAQMIHMNDDRAVIAAVSRALGESRSLIRNRGFQLIEIMVFEETDSLNGGNEQWPIDDVADSDVVDLATVTGVDWDRYDDSRMDRRSRRRRTRVA